MIGNDIVDLSISKVGEGKRRERFLKKIFTYEEIDFIQHAKEEDFMIWLMWSIKESVYKIIARQENMICFAPKSIYCKKIIRLTPNCYESSVMYKDQLFSAKSINNNACIHTIALNETVQNSTIQSSTFTLPNKVNSSLFVDDQVETALMHDPSNRNCQISIQRDKIRVPHVFYNDKEVGMLSLSHHGRFAGYAYLP